MIPNDPEERKKMIKRMLDVCAENKDELNSWESDFVDSCEGKFESRETLSDRQCEILEKIYDKL